ncbi:MAG: hypothetical protein NTU61_03590 [Candidatus Altiarchaeota archaeon]|nr:hypothetical protein [Candidatus Altiarchaeota archaeon]
MVSIIYKNLEARRFGIANTPSNINNNSTLTSVSSDNNMLQIGFVFSSTYEPNIGVIRIEGDMKMEDDAETVTKVMNSWKESQHKNIPNEIAEKIHNRILSNCIVEASMLARDIDLPAPFPAPHIAMASKQSAAESNVDTQSYIR